MKLTLELIAAFVSGIVIGVVLGSTTDKDEKLRKELQDDIERFAHHPRGATK
jgi:F0F1-type ATP synthase assembly protein I